MRNWAEDKIMLVLIRHGSTKANLEHRYLGKTDMPLSEDGKKELMEYGRRKGYPAVDYLFSSPMKRCVQTAEILYPGEKPVCIEEWAEMDFGEWEGKNYQDLKGDEYYRRWVEGNGMLPFPGGESREDFISRCEKGFLRMEEGLKQNRAFLQGGKAGCCRPDGEKRMETVGMIVHGGTIMALLSKYGGGNYFGYQIANGKGYICICKGLPLSPKITGIREI